MLGARTGAVVGIGYAASWGLLSAMSFDFHEVCFAVPLLAFALESLVPRRWTAAVLWALPLIGVKEDLPLTIAAIGVYLWWQGQRRTGAIVAAAGTLTSALLIGVVVPALNNTGHYDHWSHLYDDSMSTMAGLAIRATTVLCLLAPTPFVALRSPLLLLAVPTLTWRFVSGNPAYWDTDYHYSAVLMPIVFVAFIDGLARQVLAGIPDGAGVAASNRLAPQRTGRCRVQLFPPLSADGPLPEWVAAARPFSWPAPAEVQEARLAELRDEGYDVVTDLGHITLLHRRGP